MTGLEEVQRARELRHQWHSERCDDGLLESDEELELLTGLGDDYEDDTDTYD